MFEVRSETTKRSGHAGGRENTVATKTNSLKSWLDHLTESDTAFKAKVEERLGELRIREELDRKSVV